MKLTVEWQEVVTYRADIEVPDDVDVEYGSLAERPALNEYTEEEIWIAISELDKTPDQCDSAADEITWIGEA